MTGQGPTFKDFVKVRLDGGTESGPGSSSTVEYLQVRGIFRALYEDGRDSTLLFFGRWAERLEEVDNTRSQILGWEKPSTRMTFYQDWYLDVVDGTSVLEPCTVLPKPFGTPDDDFDISDTRRKMWVHERGRTSYGET